MNHAYRLVWNDRDQGFVPAPETARARGKRGRQKVLVASLAALGMLNAQAAPVGGQVAAGSGSISQSGSLTTIRQSSQNLSLNWQKFGIAQGETVRFEQPNASAIALNRVLGNEQSQIFGSLQANGQVFLINSNGVLFGKTAQVDVGGLVASTLNISDADFMSGNYRFAGNGGSVTNQGVINAPNGYVALLGGQVGNEGTLTARLGTVALAAGNAVTLSFAGNKLLDVQVSEGAIEALAANKQLIQADGGTVILTASAKDALLDAVVNNTGLIEARTISNQGGTIKLLGDMNYGTVIVDGRLDASAPDGGNGGFIETSAHKVKVADSVRITTLASNGQNGTWLIDPPDFTVAASGGDITGATLSSQLNSGNVQILSSQGTVNPSGSGDINVNDAVSWTANSILTLSAVNNININANLAATGNTAGLVLTPNTGSTGGTYNLAMGNSITLSGSSPSLSIAGQSYTVINSIGVANDATTSTLQGMQNGLSGRYALGSNIDASVTSTWNSGAGFTPVGNGYATEFAGTLDGLGHAISSLAINRPSADYVGLLGSLSGSGVIKNVGMAGANITGNNQVGALVGYSQGMVGNSFATGTVVGNSMVGGLLGMIGDTGSVSRSHAIVTLTGNNSLGGLVGYNAGVVSNNYSGGSVAGNPWLVGGDYNHYVGGLVGYNYGTISSSHSSSVVSGILHIGGLVGSHGSGTVSDSYATGSVEGGVAAGGASISGGLIGYIDYGTVSNSFSTGTVTGSYASGGLVGFSNQGSISDSYSTGSVSGYLYAGGLVGFVNPGSITKSFSTGAVSGNQYAGGLVGQNYGDINNSYATGTVTANLKAGGLVSVNSGAISNTYSTGHVSSANFAGGLVGSNDSGTVNNSYSAGLVSCHIPAYCGGLVSTNNSGTVNNSFWNTTTSGQSSSAGGTGLTTTQMQSAANFSGFNFTTTPGLGGNNWVIVDAWGGSLNNAGGTGGTYPMLSSEYSTTINNAHQLQLISMNMSAQYKQGRNISFGAQDVWVGDNFVPIGNPSGQYFNGTFDGQGFTISNLKIETASNFVGLFGYVGLGTIVNAGLVGGSFSGNQAVGSLAGGNHGHIFDSYSTATVTGGVDSLNIGGLVGSNSGGRVERSFSTGNVTAGPNSSHIGGLVGFSTDTINRSYASGNVSGGSGSDAVGGLVGWLIAGNVIESFANGNVVGGTNVGGLIGTIGSGAGIYRTYATGNVTGGNSGFVGGLVGRNESMISGGYSFGTVAGGVGSVLGGLVGWNGVSLGYGYWNTTANPTLPGVGSGSGGLMFGLSAAQMNLASSFSGFDFSSDWYLTGSAAPILRNSPFVLTLAYGSASQVYGAVSPSSLAPTYSNLWASDTSAVVSGLSVSTSATSTSSVGSYSVTGVGASAVSGTGNNYTIIYSPGTLTVTAKPLTVTGESVANKVYDATTNATLSGGALVGVVSGDVVNLVETGVFVSKNVGDGISVIANDSLSGASAGNYTLTQPVGLTGSITKKSVAAAGLSVAASKVYDATTSATLIGTANLTSEAVGAGTTSDNKVYAGDTVSVTGAAGTYNSKNVATASSVTFTGFLTGADAGNYSLTMQSPQAATITAKPVTASGLSVAASKVYDATTNATLIGSATLTNEAVGTGTTSDNKIYTGDTVSVTGVAATYNSKNVVSASSVSFTGTLVGADSSNYFLTMQSPQAATITAKELQATGLTAGNKIYNAALDAHVYTALATISGGAAFYNDGKYYTGDNVILSTAGATGTFGSKTVGTTKGVTISGLALTGADAGNYTVIDRSGAVADITAKQLTVSGLTASNKVYDADPTAGLNVGMAAITGGAASALDNKYYTGDAVTLDMTGASAIFANKNVGNGKAVTVVAGVTLAGADAGNYTLVQPTGLTANITPASLTVSGAAAQNKPYDATLTAGITGTLAGVLGSDSVSLSGGGSFGSAGVGNAKPVTASLGLGGTDAGNYLLTQPVGLSANITQAILTIAANNASKTKGNPNPALGVSYSGFAAGEGVGILVAPPTVSTTAVTDSPVGSYVITASGANAGPNYLLQYLPGVLTVTPVSLATSSPGYQGVLGSLGGLMNGGGAGGSGGAGGGGFGGAGGLGGGTGGGFGGVGGSFGPGGLGGTLAQLGLIGGGGGSGQGGVGGNPGQGGAGLGGGASGQGGAGGSGQGGASQGGAGGSGQGGAGGSGQGNSSGGQTGGGSGQFSVAGGSVGGFIPPNLLSLLRLMQIEGHGIRLPNGLTIDDL